MIARHDLEVIWRHAIEEYPFECCGIITTIKGAEGSTLVHKCKNIQNDLHAKDSDTYPRDAKTAYVIDPIEQFSIIRESEKRGAALVGVYHSHPENGAYFSQRDREMAFFMGELLYPEAEYLVVSVMNRVVTESVSYQWDAEKSDFNEVFLFKNCD